MDKMEEKNTAIDSPRQDESDLHFKERYPTEEHILTEPDWTPEEERAARRKIDFILLPILLLAFFALQMDRGNISNALTSTITKDLHVTTDQINVGTQLLSAGIVVLEIPSNIILQKVGAQKWISAQIICWGLIATFQLFITNYGSYLATRLLLGLFESGFIPGSLYIMSTWYTKKETSLRVSIFFLGNILAAATTALIGAGILSMSGRYGLAGWRWLFLIEGVITVGVGILFTLFLPPSVGNGRPLISFGRWSYFTPRESHIMIKRVILDDPSKATVQKIPAAKVFNTLTRPRILVHFVISLTATITVSALNTYSPSIIKSMGFGTVRANAMYSVGVFCGAVFVVVLGFLSDKTKQRGLMTLIAAAWSLISYICLRETPTSAGKWTKYAAITTSNVCNSTVHILNVGWLSVNCKDPQQRSIAMAIVIMAANFGALAGAQVFRTADAPLYHTGFTVVLALAALAFAVVIIQTCWYAWSNHRLRQKNDEEVPTIEGAGLVEKWRWQV